MIIRLKSTIYAICKFILNCKYILLLAYLMFLCVIPLSCTSKSHNIVKNNLYEQRVVHISFDDVHKCLEDLKKYEHKYYSVFEQPFFKLLKEYNTKYNAKFTLYLFEYVNDWHISDTPDKFKQELADNSDWLKFGYHGDTYGKKPDVSLMSFIQSYDSVNHEIQNFSSKDNLSHILRLGYFDATDSIRTYLRCDSVALLCADDSRISYSLPKHICDSLNNNDSYLYQGQLFYKTDLRVEKIKVLEVNNVLQSVNQDTIVIFTHEWAMNCVNKYKLSRLLHTLDGCEYIN